MKIKHIKKLADKFIKNNDLREEDYFLITIFVAFLDCENKIRKCGTADGSPQMPILPNLD